MGKGRPQQMLGQGVGSSRGEQRGGDAGWERMTESQQVPGKRHTQRHVRQEPEPGSGRQEASWPDHTGLGCGGGDPEVLTARNQKTTLFWNRARNGQRRATPPASEPQSSLCPIEKICLLSRAVVRISMYVKCLSIIGVQ